MNTTKLDLRNEVSFAIEEFLKSGGIITVERTVKRKSKMMASGHQKHYFGWAAPKNRPIQNWDFIETTNK
jgi:hypothetical protein